MAKKEPPKTAAELEAENKLLRQVVAAVTKRGGRGADIARHWSNCGRWLPARRERGR